MKRALILVCLAGCVMAVSTAEAQRVLTYDEAINIALRNGILLNQQRNNLDYAQMQKLNGVLGLGPTVSAGGSVTRYDGNTFNQNELKVVNGLFDNVSGSINFNQNLFSGFSQFNRARQYISLQEAQEFYVNRTRQDLINTVSSQYLNVLLDKELLTITNENFTVLDKQLNLIVEQVNAGSKSPVDQYNQDSQAKAAKIAALQAESQLLADRMLLLQTLLLDPSEEIEVVKPEWDPNVMGAGTDDLASLTSTALTLRGDFLRAVKNEEGAKYGMRAAMGSMMPSVGAYYTVYSAYNHDHSDPAVRPFSTQFKTDNFKKYYGLQVNIPIFGGQTIFQNRTFYVQQKVNYRNTQILKKNAEIQVKTDVTRAFKSFDLNKRIYTATIDQLKSAEIAFQYESERYNLGATDFVTYLNANRVLVQAQTGKAQAEYRLVFQKIVLDYAVGTLRQEGIEAQN